MALVQVKELFKRSSSIVIIPQTTKQYVRSWQVVVDDNSHDAVAIENFWVAQTGIIAGTSFPSDPFVFAKDIRTNCTDISGEFWEVTCNYGSLDNTDNEPNELLKPAMYEWSFSQFSETTQRDVWGTPIINSAGEMWLNGVQRDQSRPVLKINHNEATFSPLLAASYKDTINSTPFLGAPVRCVKCSNISAKSAYDGNYGNWYWVVDYEFHFDLRTWDYQPLDMGLNKINTTTNKRVPILDGADAITNPTFLDGGQPMAEGGTPTVLRYQIYNDVPFTTFVF